MQNDELHRQPCTQDKWITWYSKYDKFIKKYTISIL